MIDKADKRRRTKCSNCGSKNFIDGIEENICPLCSTPCDASGIAIEGCKPISKEEDFSMHETKICIGNGNYVYVTLGVKVGQDM